MQAATTVEQSDWTEDIKRYGDSRGWKPFSARRPLSKFREFSGRWDASGVAADSAFRRGYNALRSVTPEQREAVRTWPGLKSLVRKLEEAHLFEVQARTQAARELLEALKDRPNWQLVAGENSTVVKIGTLAEVRRAVNCLPSAHLPKDPYCGRGAWLVLAPMIEGEEGAREAASGWFTRDGAHQTHGPVVM